MNLRKSQNAVASLWPLSLVLWFTVLAMAGCQGGLSPRSEAAPGEGIDASEPATDQPLSKSNESVSKPAEKSLAIEIDPDARLGGVIRSIFQDSHGTLWIGGEGDLFRNDGKVLTSYAITDADGRGVTIKQIVESADGTIWCATTGGITRIDGDSFTSFGEADGLISRDVWSLAAGEDGVLWIGTIKGACRYDGSTFTPFELPEAERDPSRGITSSTIIHCITVDRRGRVWFGTNGGVYIFDGDTLSNLSIADGLPGKFIGSIIEDREDKIWIGTTHNGISRYDGKAFSNFTADGVIDGKEIWCIHEDPLGNIWFAGKHMGVYCYDGSKFTHFDDADGLSSPGIMSIGHDAEGRIWLGGAQGLYRRVKDRFVPVTKEGPWQ